MVALYGRFLGFGRICPPPCVYSGSSPTQRLWFQTPETEPIALSSPARQQNHTISFTAWLSLPQRRLLSLPLPRHPRTLGIFDRPTAPPSFPPATSACTCLYHCSATGTRRRRRRLQSISVLVCTCTRSPRPRLARLTQHSAQSTYVLVLAAPLTLELAEPSCTCSYQYP